MSLLVLVGERGAGIPRFCLSSCSPANAMLLVLLRLETNLEGEGGREGS